MSSQLQTVKGRNQKLCVTHRTRVVSSSDRTCTICRFYLLPPAPIYCTSQKKGRMNKSIYKVYITILRENRKSRENRKKINCIFDLEGFREVLVGFDYWPAAQISACSLQKRPLQHHRFSSKMITTTITTDN